RDAVGGRLLDEGRDTVRVRPLVDVELVGPEPAIAEPRVADINVEPPVAVHVGERDAGRPSLALPAGLLGDVAEVEFALVEIQPSPTEIRREHDLRQPVTREVADCDATAVVV